MSVLSDALSPEQIDELRQKHPYSIDESWLQLTLRTEGWWGANARYLQYERQRSAVAMRALMEALGIRRVHSAEEATDLIACAVEVFAPPSGFSGRMTRETGTCLRIENGECPFYCAREEAERSGVTSCPAWHGHAERGDRGELSPPAWYSMLACPTWHRHSGWMDALNVRASDRVLGEKKWGDGACISLITVEAVVGIPAREESVTAAQQRVISRFGGYARLQDAFKRHALR